MTMSRGRLILAFLGFRRAVGSWTAYFKSNRFAIRFIKF